MSYSIVDDAYGKNNVKLLHVKRDGPVHSIQELEVNTELTLATHKVNWFQSISVNFSQSIIDYIFAKDYVNGDNSDIIATDSQKNTVYLLAQKHGVTCPEQFAILLCRHFLKTYDHVLKVKVYVEQYPWQRIDVDGKKHNHAFVLTPVAIRFATAILKRGGGYL